MKCRILLKKYFYVYQMQYSPTEDWRTANKDVIKGDDTSVNT